MVYIDTVFGSQSQNFSSVAYLQPASSWMTNEEHELVPVGFVLCDM